LTEGSLSSFFSATSSSANVSSETEALGNHGSSTETLPSMSCPKQ
jgi:hypothetical protein